MVDRPKLVSESQKELDKVEAQFDQFEKQMQALSGQGNPVTEREEQSKLSSKEQNNTDAPYIKPNRTIGSKEAFNEKFRATYDYSKQYVRVIAENNEIKGETIEVWTKPFPGVPAEFWKVPVNKPIYIPRYLASQIATRVYNKYVMEDRPTHMEGGGTFYGSLIAKETMRRLDCRPAAAMSLSMFT